MAINYELLVIENFAGYEKGDIITDEKTISGIVGSENEHHIIKKAKEPAAAKVAQ